MVDSEIKLSQFTMNWEFTKMTNVKGRMDLRQIFKEFSFKFKNIVRIINDLDQIRNFLNNKR